MKTLLFLILFGLVSSRSELKKKNLGLNPQIINFLAGGIAGSIASTLTTPLEVVKSQLQSSVMKDISFVVYYFPLRLHKFIGNCSCH